MIPRTIVSALFHAAIAVGVCTKLEDCKQFQHLKTSSCQTYHHIIARGSNSPYPGHVIETVGKVCNALNTHERPNACGYEDVIYRAETGGEKWCTSSHEGAVNAAAQMTKYSVRCPGSHLILMGFSQGGSVLLDALGGGGGELWGCMQADNPPMNISTSPGSKVAAALVFGPTRRSANQTWTQGGGQAYNGASPRSPAELLGLQPYAAAGNLREYCHPGDPICAKGSSNTSMAKHLNYFDIYSDEAAAWVLDRIQNAPALPDIPSGASLHPVANVFLLLFVLIALYFLIRKVVSWKASRDRLASYAPVNTSESV